MKFGVCIPNYGETLSVETMRSVALEAENLGYDSVWTTDHILMQRNSNTPYEKILDSVSTIAYLASETKRVKLGISSLIIAMRNPVVVAKQLATVDQLSGGRLKLAIGSGWNEPEFSFLGSNFHNRGRRVDESITLIRKLWAGETKFDGVYSNVKFNDVVFDPRPVQQNLSIWIGGTSEAAMKRAVELGDAWHPNVMPLDSFRKMMKDFRGVSPNAKDADVCVRVGINVRASKSEYIGPRGEKRFSLSGDMTENRKTISELESLGVSYAVLVPSRDGKSEMDEQIESLRAFAEMFLK